MKDPGMAIGEIARENWFWAGVLRDHATFIRDGLAPQERRAAEHATAFAQRFEVLREEAEALTISMGLTGPAGSYALDGLPQTAPLERFHGAELLRYQQSARAVAGRTVELLRSLRQFKEELLQQKLACTITLNLAPTLLQHMINEAEEGYRALSGAREAANLPPALEALHHHLLWLPDAAGHAAALHSGLDAVEHGLLESTARFKQTFEGMEIMAIELHAMLRVAPRMVGALRRLNRDAIGQIAIFRSFLAELREHLEGCEVLGNLTPLFADHMLREELYYTEKVTALRAED
ncbi:MAG: DUF2935 domain-containing protein [Bacillota bacterium]